MLERYAIEYNNHSQNDFKDVWNIESQYLEPSTIASINQVMEWDKKNNDIHIFVRDRSINKIVGEITSLPLSEEQYKNFLINKLEDTELNAENLLKYNDNDSYYLLFSAIAIDKEYRNTNILGYLLEGLYVKLNMLSKKGIKFKNMCAEGQTNDGQKFLENFLNLKEKCVTKDGYKLYSFNNTDEMNQWLIKFPSYIEKYKLRFK